MMNKTNLTVSLTAIIIQFLLPQSLMAEARVESNVIYGMRSGLALLMDVHYPAEPNGLGIIIIPGSGWSAPLSLDAEPLKEGIRRPYLGAQPLIASGYTLFSINHRASPEYSYPDPVRDAERAVRFVRFHAAEFGIDADRIGALGGSSGGHLVLMLALMDGNGSERDPSPINEVSSKVQTVVAIFPATDFIAFVREGNSRPPLFRARLPARLLDSDTHSMEVELFREASPVTYVSPDDPPVLLIHGDQDSVVPYSQSEILAEATRAVGIETHLIRMPGGGHGPSIVAGPDAPNFLDPLVAWFDRHLKK